MSMQQNKDEFTRYFALFSTLSVISDRNPIHTETENMIGDQKYK